MIYKCIAAVGLALSAHISAAISTEKLFFVESFNDDPFTAGRWVKSLDPKYVDQPLLYKSANMPADGYANDNGLQLSKEMRYYGFGSTFAQPLDFKGKKEVVIQYELKLEESLTCGGAYIKLPRASPTFNMAYLNNDTPYTIMFGPDKCGSGNNKVHFIIQHQNPLTSEWEEKHFTDTPPVKTDKNTHLYTLALRDDNTFAIYVDKESVKSGNLLLSMLPSVNPPKEIDDPDDKKPEDWVDEAKIDDPEATKPDDWDESQPQKVIDEKATKPVDWLEDAPLTIADPTASKPDDWDDEEDGVWEAPNIDNPACEKAGCGPWSAPLIKNPLYKGKWYPPKIDNPAYKGVWAPRKIPNKDFFEDLTPMTGLAPMAGIAVEVWTTNGAILFDNFVVATSLQDAFEYADATFTKKAAEEEKLAKAAMKDEAKKTRAEILASGSAKDILAVYMAEVAEFTMENPIPVAATVIAVLLAVYLMLPNPKKRAPPAAPTTEPAADADADDAATAADSAGAPDSAASADDSSSSAPATADSDKTTEEK